MTLSNPSAGQPQQRPGRRCPVEAGAAHSLEVAVTVVHRSPSWIAAHPLVSKLINDPSFKSSAPVGALQSHQRPGSGQGHRHRAGELDAPHCPPPQYFGTLSDQLIEFDDPSVVLTLVRNSGANFSHHAFPRLADHAQRHHALLAPLSTRPDLPAPIAFELFWFVPAELRRYLLSRFLTDSETLTKILKITHAMGGGEQGAETKFPDREQIESFVEFLNAGKHPEAANLLAEIAAIHTDNAVRIIADANGDP